MTSMSSETKTEKDKKNGSGKNKLLVIRFDTFEIIEFRNFIHFDKKETHRQFFFQGK